MLKTLKANPLGNIPCFSGLSEATSAIVSDSIVECSYSRDQVVFFEGDPCTGLFIIKTGRVKLYRSSPGGDEHIVRVLGTGGCFECAPLFDGGPNPVSAQAMDESTLFFLPADAFRSILLTPGIALQFASVLALRLRSLLNQVEDMSLRPVGARLARLLLQMSEHDTGTKAERASFRQLNQQHLACMLGCTRQMVNTSLGKLVREGMVRKEGKRLIVLKPEELRRIGEEA